MTPIKLEGNQFKQKRSAGTNNTMIKVMGWGFLELVACFKLSFKPCRNPYFFKPLRGILQRDVDAWTDGEISEKRQTATKDKKMKLSQFLFIRRNCLFHLIPPSSTPKTELKDNCFLCPHYSIRLLTFYLRRCRLSSGGPSWKLFSSIVYFLENGKCHGGNQTTLKKAFLKRHSSDIISSPCATVNWNECFTIKVFQKCDYWCSNIPFDSNF